MSRVKATEAGMTLPPLGRTATDPTVHTKLLSLAYAALRGGNQRRSKAIHSGTPASQTLHC